LPLRGAGCAPYSADVSHFMSHTYTRISVIVILGLIAPLWWTWAVSHLIYGFFLLGGASEHPSTIFAWTSILLPSIFLGLAVGAAIFLLVPRFMLRGWALFWVSLMVGSFAFGLAAGNFAAVGELFRSVGTLAFLVGSLVVPLIMSVRGRHG